jgi:hypothetical protein
MFGHDPSLATVSSPRQLPKVYRTENTGDSQKLVEPSCTKNEEEPLNCERGDAIGSSSLWRNFLLEASEPFGYRGGPRSAVAAGDALMAGLHRALDTRLRKARLRSL